MTKEQMIICDHCGDSAPIVRHNGLVAFDIFPHGWKQYPVDRFGNQVIHLCPTCIARGKGKRYEIPLKELTRDTVDKIKEIYNDQRTND